MAKAYIFLPVALSCWLICTQSIESYFDNDNSEDLPEITEPIQPEEQQQGMTGYLNCTVARQGIHKVFWVHKQAQIVITINDEVILDTKLNPITNGYPKYEVAKIATDEQDTTVYCLIINRLEEQDAGQYTCLIALRGRLPAESISEDGNLTVIVPSNIQTGQCNENEFYCSTARLCIPAIYRCDHWSDCSDNEDEVGCPCDFTCDADKCISFLNVCDGFKSCSDGRDEQDCEFCDEESFHCSADKTCIPYFKQCDLEKDCTDGEDERNCSYRTN